MPAIAAGYSSLISDVSALEDDIEEIDEGTYDMDSVLTKSDLVLAEEALAALVAGGGSIDATATGITTLTDALVVL